MNQIVRDITILSHHKWIERNMVTAKMSSKFQISIPKEVREQMHLEAGQAFYIIPKGNTIQLVPVRSLDELRGMMKGAQIAEYRIP